MTSSTHLSQASPDPSTAARFAELFRRFGRDGAPVMLRAVLAQLSTVEKASLAANWTFWARGKQLPPSGDWKRWGFLTGRRFGKTWAVSNFVNEEVTAGRARLIGLAAQDEANTVAIQVKGVSGLIATALPGAKPELHTSAEGPVLTWPNGAKAYIRTPEVPSKIRGLEFDLSWLTEMQSWPASTRMDALKQFQTSTCVGTARIVWDATPKRRHPLLKEFLAEHERDPKRYVIVRGILQENTALPRDYVADIVAKMGNTRMALEEIYGQMLEDSDGALVKQQWIDDARRNMPGKLLRRVISIDPAVSDRAGSDTTGIIEAGLGTDGQGYVLGDASGKHKPEAWGALILDAYIRHDLDLVIAETNKGGQLVASNLRALAKERGLEVVVIGKDDSTPQRTPGKVYLREVFARGAKEDRAEPVATAYERRRVSHVVGADLASLEDTLTTWEPSSTEKRYDSPGDLDALVHAMVELLDLSRTVLDPAKDFIGFSELAKQVASPVAAQSISSIAFTLPTYGQDCI